MFEHKSIITENWNICYECGKPPVHCHHLMNGIAYRSKATKYGLMIPLCAECHSRIHNSPVRMNWYKQKAQREFEKKYSHEKWMSEFHKCYLEYDG